MCFHKSLEIVRKTSERERDLCMLGGIDKVEIETGLLALAHNLAKMEACTDARLFL